MKRRKSSSSSRSLVRTLTTLATSIVVTVSTIQARAAEPVEFVRPFVLDGHSGFFVTSATFKKLDLDASLLASVQKQRDENKMEADELRKAVAKIPDLTASFTRELTETRKAWQESEKQLRDVDRRTFLEEPALWLGLGLVAAGVIFYLAKNSPSASTMLGTSSPQALLAF